MTDSTILAFRIATYDDDAVLRELAALDSARPLRRPALLAIVDGRPVAAGSLRDGDVVADPFTPTGDVVELLRARLATHAAARRPRRSRLRVRRLRPAH